MKEFNIEEKLQSYRANLQLEDLNKAMDIRLEIEAEFKKLLPTPKLPLSALADNREDCEKIAEMICSEGWAFSKVSKQSDFTAIEITAHPLKFAYLKIYNDSGMVFHHEHRVMPIKNCLQICAFILERYEINGEYITIQPK